MDAKDGVRQGEQLKERMNRGITFLKNDFGIELLPQHPRHALGARRPDRRRSGRSPCTRSRGSRSPTRASRCSTSTSAALRAVVGMEVPLAADHFGHIGVNSCIRLARAMEKHNLAWMEDMVPWQLGHLMKQIADNTTVPILTGEDIYLKEDFVKLIDMGAVDVIHPDLASSGGILETKKIGDYAMEHGVPMAMHFAGSPISFMANVHCAAATENFVALEHHSLDVPWWNDLVTPAISARQGLRDRPRPPRPRRRAEPRGDRRHHLLEPGYFEPTPEWDKERSWDRLWS